MTSEELLKQHYNQANALYQAGNLFQAHQELQAALEYATTDQQRESIRDNMKRIEALLEQARIQVPQSAVSEEAVHPEAPAEAEPRFWQNKNKLGVLLLLVALICLLPITIKCIEIFTPRKPVTEASP
jgi:hypothetical protein